MLRRFLPFAAAISLLPGCLLTQTPPAPAVDKSAANPIVGFVGMEDIRGAGVGAGLMAVFGRKPPSRAWGARSGRYFGNERSLTEDESRADGAFQCGIERTAKTQPAGRDTAAPTGFVDVGKLAYGIALQTTFFLFTESDDHRYSARLAPDVPADLYQIQSEGTAQVPAFSVLLSMPEALHQVAGNGVPFEQPLTQKKSESLVVTWQAPTIPNDANKIMLDLETQSATEKITLHCWGDEKNSLTNNPMLGWEIPTEALTPLATDGKAKIFFVRGHVKTPASSALALKLQGLRTYFGKISLSE